MNGLVHHAKKAVRRDRTEASKAEVDIPSVWVTARQSYSRAKAIDGDPRTSSCSNFVIEAAKASGCSFVVR